MFQGSLFHFLQEQGTGGSYKWGTRTKPSLHGSQNWIECIGPNLDSTLKPYSPTAQGLSVDNDIEATQLDISDDARFTNDNIEGNLGGKIVEPIKTQSQKRVAQNSVGKLEEEKKRI